MAYHNNITNNRIPSVENISTDWITRVLRAGGVLNDSEVIAITFEPVGEGKGHTGKLKRIHLRYNREEQKAPKSIIIKSPLSNPKLRTILGFSALYEREVRFYLEIASQTPVLTPVCYFGAFNSDEVDSILVLEDLGKHVTLKHSKSFNVTVSQAVRELAMLHAFWWESQKLEEYTWMPRIGEHAESSAAIFSKLWPSFIEVSNDTVAFASKKKILAGLQDLIALALKRMGSNPVTLLHGDFRPDNLVFFPGWDSMPENTTINTRINVTSSHRLALIDWQLVAQGRGTIDLAYYMTSFPHDYRRIYEKIVLSEYHSLLEQYGVNGYSMDQCLEDYRISLIEVLVRTVIGGSFFRSSSSSAGNFYSRRFNRCLVALTDHEVDQLF